MTEHVRTVHEGKKRIYKEVNCQVILTSTWPKLLDFLCIYLRNSTKLAPARLYVYLEPFQGINMKLDMHGLHLIVTEK